MTNKIEQLIIAEPGEQIKMMIRRHWLGIFSISLMLVFILIIPLVALFFLIGYYPGFFQGAVVNIVVLILFAYILILALSFLISYIKFYFDIFVVTDRRIIDIQQVGLFNRHLEELGLLNIEDISVEVKGFIRTAFNFGDVIVETAAEHPDFKFETVPNPQEFARKVMKLYEALLEREQNPTEPGEKQIKASMIEKFGLGKALEISQPSVQKKQPAQEPTSEIESDKLNGAVDNQAKTEYQKKLNEAYKEAGVLKEGEEVDLKQDENK